MKTITGRAAVFINDQGNYEIGRLVADEVNAKRSIHMFEGRRFAGIATVTFDLDETGRSGMVFRADEKLAGRIPCNPEQEAADGGTAASG